MKNNSSFVITSITLAMLGFLTAVGVLGQSPSDAIPRGVERFANSEVVRGEVLVKFTAAGASRAVGEIESSSDLRIKKNVGRSGARLIRSRDKSTAELLAIFSRRSDVLYAEPNYIITLNAAPNDPRFGDAWGLSNTGQATDGTNPGTIGADIDAAPAWDITKGSRSAVVAVVDTGVDHQHPDLAANMWSAPAAFTVNIGGQAITCESGTHGFNAITRTCGDTADDHNHGTHVAGTIGAVGDNGVGTAGVNWIASIMSLKFIDHTGSGTVADAIDAIDFAIQAKHIFGSGADVRVLSNSWGWLGEPSLALLEAIDLTNENNMLFVAGAGNGGDDLVGDDNDAAPFYPASYDVPNVISVAATNNNDGRAGLSNFGANSVDLGAPGVLIFSTVIGGSYDYFTGTSMATPHVSGGAALVLSACTLDTPSLKAALVGNVDPIPSLAGITVAGGRLNVNRSIRACINQAPVANAGGPYVGSINQSIQFNGGGSIDPDGTIVSYRWDFGDGVTSSIAATAHTYLRPGTYSVALTVTDDLGAQSTAATTATIADSLNPPTDLAAEVRMGEIRLRWTDNSGNEQYFHIERSTNSAGGFTYIGRASANATVYPDKTVQRKQNYFYRVRAVTPGGTASAYSNIISVRTK